MTTERRIVAVVAAVLLLLLAFSIHRDARAAPLRHWCTQGDPPILASHFTSCAFAGNVVTAYAQFEASAEGAAHTASGTVKSPVTHHVYFVKCVRPGPRWQGHVTCRNAHHHIWLRFSADL